MSLIDKNDAPLLYVYYAVNHFDKRETKLSRVQIVNGVEFHKSIDVDHLDFICSKVKHLAKEITEIISKLKQKNKKPTNTITKLKLIENKLSKILKSKNKFHALETIKRINDREIKSIIPKADIAKLFEIVKVKISDSFLNISNDIKRYRFFDQTQLFEIAQNVAKQRIWGISKYIKNYGILDQELRFKIAKFAAEKDEREVSKYIQDFGDLTQAQRFELAKILAANYIGNISQYIQNYGYLDQAQRFEIAKIAAKHNGEQTSQLIQNYGDLNSSQLFEIACIAAGDRGEGTSKYIQNYGIQDHRQLCEVAEIAMKGNVEGASKYIQNYGILTKEDWFRIIKMALFTERIPKYIQNFACLDQLQRIQLAAYIIQESWGSNGCKTVSEYFQNFGIQDPIQRFDIAKIVAENNPESLSQFIGNYDLDQMQKFELAKIAAQRNGLVTSQNIQNFGNLDQSQQFQIAKIAAEKGWNSSEFFHNFNLLDQDQQYQIALIAVKNDICTSQYIQNYSHLNKAQQYEIAKIALKLGISPYIQKYHLLDQSQLIEIAKLSSEVDGEQVSKYIRNYGKLSQLDEFEIAKIAAGQKGMASKYIQNYSSLDREQRFEIAKISAKRNGTSTSEYIQNYGDLTNVQRFEIAKIAAEESGCGMSRSIQKYGDLDQLQQFEIAMLVVTKGDTISDVIHHFDKLNQLQQYEIAKNAAIQSQRNWGEVSLYIKNYTYLDQAHHFEIAKIAAAKNGTSVSKYIQNYKFSDPLQHFEVAKFAAAQSGEGVSTYIQNYKFSDPSHYFEIAKIAAAQSGKGVSEYIDHYPALSQTQRFEIAKISASQNGPSTVVCIEKYGELTKDQQYEIATIAFTQSIDTSRFIDRINFHPIKHMELFIYCCGLYPHEILNLIEHIAQVAKLGSKYSFKNFLGFQLMLNPNRPLLSDEKANLGFQSNFDFAERSAFKNFDAERTILHQWIGIYLFKLNLWLLTSKAENASQRLCETDPNKPFLLSYKSKALAGVVEKAQHERLNKKEQKMLKKREILDISPLLKAISKLRHPTMRYKLVQLMFKNLHNAQSIGSLEVFRQLGHEKLGTTDRSIFRLLLTQLIYEEDKNKDFTDCNDAFQKWATVFLTLSLELYKNPIYQMPVINTLNVIIEDPYLSIASKNRIVQAIFALGQTAQTAKEKVAIINLNMRLMEAIIQSGKHDALQKLVSEMQDAKFPSNDFLQHSLQGIFKSIIGEVEIKEFAEKFDRTFLSGRQPFAFITYATKFQGLPGSEMDAMLPCLRSLYVDILDGNFQSNRYNSTPGDHLDQIFSWKKNSEEKKTWENIWKNGISKPLKLEEADEKYQNEIDKDFKKYLHEKVCSDKHISPSDFPILKTFLNNPIDFAQIDKIIEEIIRLEEPLLKEKSESKNQIQKLQLQKELISLCDIRKSIADKERSIEAAIELTKKIFPQQNDHQFLRDLQDLEKMMHSEQKRKVYTGWTVEDSDHWEDLLLSGTEVLGSCQNINNDCHYNKCLMNYLLDGKNRVVAIKNSEGHIQARVIIRLLWDAASKQPVLYRERLYKSPGVSDACIHKLDEVCAAKAKALGIPLLRAMPENNKGIAYPHDIESLNGRAPFEYVDAGSIGITNGKFTIPSKKILQEI